MLEPPEPPLATPLFLIPVRGSPNSHIYPVNSQFLQPVLYVGTCQLEKFITENLLGGENKVNYVEGWQGGHHQTEHDCLMQLAKTYQTTSNTQVWKVFPRFHPVHMQARGL